MGMKQNCCPRCGSLKVTESFDSKGIAQYKCCACRSRFGNEDEAIGYVGLLVKFLIEIKDILGNKMVLKLTKEANICKYYLKLGRNKGYEGCVSFDFWNDFSSKLFVEYSFHKWNDTYFGAMGNEGIIWDMEASFERRHTLSVHGCDSFPVYWKRIVSLILPLLDEGDCSDSFVHRLVQEK